VPIVYDEHDHYELNTLEGQGPLVVRRFRQLLVRVIHQTMLPFVDLVTCIRMRDGLLGDHLKRWQRDTVELHNYPVKSWVQQSQQAHPQGRLCFVYVGGVFREKGLGLIASAFAHLRESGHASAELHVFGSGNEALLQELRQQVGVTLHGNCTPEQIRSFANQRCCCGLVIFPDHPRYNLVGTNTRKFFEYLASGMPVITTDSGEIGPMVREHKLGLVVPRDCSPQLLGNTMSQLAEDQGTTASYARNAVSYMSQDDRCWESQWHVVRESLPGVFAAMPPVIDDDLPAAA
jgi:glycosyltransferase involved in cell wall biosynthesis